MTKTVTSKAVTKFRGNVPDQHQLFVNVLTIASHLKQEEKSYLDLVNKKWEDDYKEEVQMRCSRKKVTWSKNLHRIRSISPRQVISPPTKVARFVVTSPITSEDHSTNKSNYSMIDQLSPAILDDPSNRRIIEIIHINNFNTPNFFQKSSHQKSVPIDNISNSLPSQSQSIVSVSFTPQLFKEAEQEINMFSFKTRNTCEYFNQISESTKRS